MLYIIKYLNRNIHNVYFNISSFSMIVKILGRRYGFYCQHVLIIFFISSGICSGILGLVFYFLNLFLIYVKFKFRYLKLPVII